MKKIVGYKNSLCQRLDSKWEWTCAVWFGHGMFADAYIKGTKPFDTHEEATANMDKTIRLFGITKRTHKVW
jgi:hypothetical protein